MTPEQINIAIAEFCGWKQVMFRPGSKDVIGLPPKGETNFVTVGGSNYWCFVPNYCTDLNAMHEADGRLFGDSRIDYMDNLIDVLSGIRGQSEGRYIDDYDCCQATARQRGEALLRTIGKWRE